MRRIKGRMLRSTFGRYPDLTLANARLKAPDVLADMADGLTQGQRRTDLFKVVLDEWLKKDQAKNKSVYQVKVAMYRHALPAFGPMPVASITKRDVNRLIDKIVDDGSPVAANRVLAFTKRFFSWCKERDILEQSPAETIKPPSKEKVRDRVLTLDEMKNIWATCDQMSYPWGPIFQLLQPQTAPDGPPKLPLPPHISRAAVILIDAALLFKPLKSKHGHYLTKPTAELLRLNLPTPSCMPLYGRLISHPHAAGRLRGLNITRPRQKTVILQATGALPCAKS